MTTFDEAIRIIGEKSVEGDRTAEIEITAATGYVLAEEVVSDIDMPRFDRAMMDGFAIRRSDSPVRSFHRIVGTISAGDSLSVPLAEGECARIMTGAPLPEAADTVVPQEESEEEGEWVRFMRLPPRGAHISPMGEDVRAGDVVLRRGTLLGPPGIGILAAAGRQTARVFAPPAVAFAATGEELVEPGEVLGPGRIWNSNAYMLQSQIAEARALPHYLGIARDREDDLRAKVTEGLGYDMLVISGGVSMGRCDLVPPLLAECGVRVFFRHVRVKPGYPTLFGARGKTLVFGLAGNPIATLFGFELYVRPVIRAFLRHPKPLAAFLRGELTESVTKREGRTSLAPCICEREDGRFLLTPIRTHGSADLFAVAGADSIAVLPEEKGTMGKGAVVRFCRIGK
ncbi:MAG: gephyrin-like molybdotransferase Glp [Candidatus Eisenbacteria bacterium]